MRGLSLTAWFQQQGPQWSSLVITLVTTFAWAQCEVSLLQSSGVLSPISSQNMNTGYSHRWLFVGLGEKEELSEQSWVPERGQTEHCMSFYCTCLRMVQYELVLCCKCLPVLFLTRGFRRSAFLEPIRIFSLNVDVYRMTFSEEGQMNELHRK